MDTSDTSIKPLNDSHSFRLSTTKDVSFGTPETTDGTPQVVETDTVEEALLNNDDKMSVLTDN